MLSCQFCNERFEDLNSLQLHQVDACPAVEHEDYETSQSDTATVQFKWIMDRVIAHPAIHLIGSELGDTVELKKGNGSYSSAPTQLGIGVYDAHLVIGDDVVAVVEFEVQLLSDVIYLIIDPDTSAEEVITSPRNQAEAGPRFPATPPLSSRQQQPSPVHFAAMQKESSEGDVNDDGLSPLHRELLEHQMQHSVPLLQEEEDNFENINDITSPRRDRFIRSPDDHTMLNIDDLQEDAGHQPQEHQQPVESEVEDFDDLSTASHNLPSVEASPRQDESLSLHGEKISDSDDLCLLESHSDDNCPVNKGEPTSFDSQQTADSNEGFLQLSLNSDFSSSDYDDRDNTQTTNHKGEDFFLLSSPRNDPPLIESPNVDGKPLRVDTYPMEGFDDVSVNAIKNQRSSNISMGHQVEITDSPPASPLPFNNPLTHPPELLDETVFPRNTQNIADTSYKRSMTDESECEEDGRQAVMREEETDDDRHNDGDSNEIRFGSMQTLQSESSFQPSGSQFINHAQLEDDLADAMRDINSSFQGGNSPLSTGVVPGREDSPPSLRLTPRSRSGSGRSVDSEQHSRDVLQPAELTSHTKSPTLIPQTTSEISQSSRQGRLVGGAVGRLGAYQNDAGTSDGYASDNNSLVEQISRPTSTENPSRRKERPDSHNRQHHQAQEEKESRKDDTISELLVKCDSYECELSRLHQQLEDMEVNKREFEAKCRSYDEEIDRLNEQCREMREQFRQETVDLANSSKKSQVEVLEVNRRCQRYEEEVARIKRDYEDLLEQTNNSPRKHDSQEQMIAELESKCQSYDHEVERLKKDNKKLRAERLDLADYGRKSREEILEVNRRCQRYEEELEKIKRSYDDLLEQKKQSSRKHDLQDEIIAEHEVKCRSYDSEIERLAQENKRLRAKNISDVKTFEADRSMRNLKDRVSELETLNRKLVSDSQSLETAHQLHEDDIEKENKRLLEKVRELERTLRLQSTSPNTSDVSASTSRACIDKLKAENKVLAEKLFHIHREADVQPSYDEQQATYRPQIISPRLSTSTSKANHRHSENLTSTRLFNANSFLPDRPKKTYWTQDDSDSDEKTHYVPAKYSTFTAPRDLSYTHPKDVALADSFYSAMNKRYSPETKVLSKDFITNMTQKYSPEAGKFSPEARFSSDFPASTVDDLLGASHIRRKETSSRSDYTFNSRKLKSRSLDVGLDHLDGYAHKEELSPSQNHKFGSNSNIPFCPTHVAELRIGMKVSVNRSSGRLSRGIIKWIGTLLRHTGDYIGIELESESGKHNGYFEGRQYFACKKDRGVFVKFPKVIMAWR